MKVTNTAKAGIQQLVEIADFQPTDSQRKLKAKFWALYADAPHIQEKPSLEYSIRLTGDLRLEKYWQQPGFKEWLLNDKESAEKLSYLYFLALDGLEELLLSTDPKMASARVQAIRLVAELGDRMPGKAAEGRFLDSDIGRMDRRQLKEFVAKNVHLLGLTPPAEMDRVSGAIEEAAHDAESQEAEDADKIF